MKIAPQTSITFFGTADFAVPVLELLVKEGWPVKLVVTQPDQPVGRHQKLQPPPVKTAANRLGLKIIQPTKLTSNLKSKILNLKLFVVCAYGKLIPADTLKIPKYGALNIHPSLLPKYRGPSPIQTALLNGDKETGVTIMLLDKEMDHGPLLAQRIVPIGEKETSPELSERLAQLGAELLLKTLPDYLSGKIKPRSQDHSQATFTKILTREDGKIDWSRPARQIYNQWRALQPWPGVWTEIRIKDKGLRIKLVKINPPTKEKISLLQGGIKGGLARHFIKLNKKELGIVCGDQRQLLIELLQPEGKKVMTAEAFINGYLQ